MLDFLTPDLPATPEIAAARLRWWAEGLRVVAKDEHFDMSVYADHPDLRLDFKEVYARFWECNTAGVGLAGANYNRIYEAVALLPDPAARRLVNAVKEIAAVHSENAALRARLARLEEAAGEVMSRWAPLDTDEGACAALDRLRAALAKEEPDAES